MTRSLCGQTHVLGGLSTRAFATVNPIELPWVAYCADPRLWPPSRGQFACDWNICMHATRERFPTTNRQTHAYRAIAQFESHQPITSACIGRLRCQSRELWQRRTWLPRSSFGTGHHCHQRNTSTGSLLSIMMSLVWEPKTNFPTRLRPWVTMTIMSQPDCSAASTMV